MPPTTSLRSLAALAAAALLTVAAAPAVSGPTFTTVGSAASSTLPLQVTVDGTPVSIGRTVLSATGGAAPSASGVLTALDVDGTTVGVVEVSSDGTTSGGGDTVTQATPVGDVTAVAGQLTATADAATGAAQAALSRLDADAGVLGALGIDVVVDGATAAVAQTGATATGAVSLPSLDLTLGALLGDALSALPLEDLIALADQLGVTLPADIDGVQQLVDATTALADAVAAAVLAADAVDAAAAQLLAADLSDLDAFDALAEYVDPATLQSLEDSLTGLDLLSDPTAALGTLTTLLADPDLASLGCSHDTPTILNLADVVADVVACIDAAQAEYAAAVANLADEATAVADAVAAYAAAVQDAVDATVALDGSGTTLADLLTAVTDLLAGIEGASLVELTGFGVTQEVLAVSEDLAGSSSTVTCSPASLSVLAQSPVEVLGCDGATTDVLAAVDQALAAVGDVLDLIGAIDTGDGLDLALFDTVTESVTIDDAGTVTATNTVEVLRLDVPAVTVDLCGVADGLVCALGADLLDPALGLPDLGVDLDDAQALADGALTTVTDLLDATGVVADVADQAGVGAVVDAAVTTLEGVLAGLDVGDLGSLGGTVLPGASVVVDPTIAASHGPVAAPAGDDPDPVVDPVVDDPAPAPASDDPAPAPVTGDGTDTPAVDTDDPELARTGGGAALGAIALLGGAAALLRRRED